MCIEFSKWADYVAVYAISPRIVATLYYQVNRHRNCGEGQFAQRQRRIKRLVARAAGVAQRLVAGPADPALPPRRRVQAQRQVERLGGGPERLVLGLVV
jgi:hypothetical protein